jgi:hypothetical protein
MRVVAPVSTKIPKQVSSPAKAAPRPPRPALPTTVTKTTFAARQKAVDAPKPTVAAAVSRSTAAAASRSTATVASRSTATVPRPIATAAPRRTAAAPRSSNLTNADRRRLHQLVPAIEKELALAREVHYGEIRRTCEHKVLHGSFSFDSSVLTEVQVAEPFRED